MKTLHCIPGLKLKENEMILKEIRTHLGSTKNPQLYLFGSRAINKFRTYSDVDLMLSAEFYDEPSLSKIDFSNLDIPYKIDFIFEKDLFKEYSSEVQSQKLKIVLYQL